MELSVDYEISLNFSTLLARLRKLTKECFFIYLSFFHSFFRNVLKVNGVG